MYYFTTLMDILSANRKYLLNVFMFRKNVNTMYYSCFELTMLYLALFYIDYLFVW